MKTQAKEQEVGNRKWGITAWGEGSVSTKQALYAGLCVIQRLQTPLSSFTFPPRIFLVLYVFHLKKQFLTLFLPLITSHTHTHLISGWFKGGS